MTIENIEKMNKDISLLHKYYELNNELFDSIDEINKKKKQFISSNLNPPTIVVPGHYTISDGKVLAELFKNLRINKYDNLYKRKLDDLIKWKDYIMKNPNSIGCVSGRLSYGMDLDCNHHVCHRSFYFNNPEYYNDLLDCDCASELKLEESDMSLIDYYINPVDSIDSLRVRYVLSGYHDFPTLKISYIVSMLKELAKSGQADKVFLRDDNLCNLFAYLCIVKLSCHMAGLLNNGSFHLIPISIIRLFANGAFIELLRDMRNDLSIREQHLNEEFLQKDVL